MEVVVTPKVVRKVSQKGEGIENGQPIEDPMFLLSKDLQRAAVTLSEHEARFLVDTYYVIQNDRKREFSQVRELAAEEAPHDIILWLANISRRLENGIRGALHIYAQNKRTGEWAMEITGVGPVIAAGLMAYIPVENTPKVSSLWRYAGQDPTCVWEKGQTRPWNANLKTLCWKIGESFVKVSNHEDDYYGKFYKQWKMEYLKRNDNGVYADQAAEILKTKNYKNETVARSWYEKGILPPAHIHARAKRKAVKLFLSHWWEAAYTFHYGKRPEAKPWVIDVGGHKHYIPPPNLG